MTTPPPLVIIHPLSACVPRSNNSVLVSQTFNSQSTFMFRYKHPSSGKDLLMYMGDRWNYHGSGSVGNATYVWLPLIPNGTTGHGLPRFTMPYLTEWKVADY